MVGSVPNAWSATGLEQLRDEQFATDKSVSAADFCEQDNLRICFVPTQGAPPQIRTQLSQDESNFLSRLIPLFEQNSQPYDIDPRFSLLLEAMNLIHLNPINEDMKYSFSHYYFGPNGELLDIDRFKMNERVPLSLLNLWEKAKAVQENRSKRSMSEVWSIIAKDSSAQRRTIEEIILFAREFFADKGIDLVKRPSLLVAIVFNEKAFLTALTAAEKGSQDFLQSKGNAYSFLAEQLWPQIATIYDQFKANPKQFRMSISSAIIAEIPPTNGFLGMGATSYPTYELTKEIPLFTWPDTCGNEISRASKNKNSLEQMMEHRSHLKGLLKQGKFAILNQRYDCERKEWSLARFQDGETGWIRNAEAKAFSKISYDSKMCAQPEFTGCVEKVKNIIGAENILAQDLQKGVLQIRLAAPPEAYEVNFARNAPRDYCYDPAERKKYLENRKKSKDSLIKLNGERIKRGLAPLERIGDNGELTPNKYSSDLRGKYYSEIDWAEIDKAEARKGRYRLSVQNRDWIVAQAKSLQERLTKIFAYPTKRWGTKLYWRGPLFWYQGFVAKCVQGDCYTNAIEKYQQFFQDFSEENIRNTQKYLTNLAKAKYNFFNNKGFHFNSDNIEYKKLEAAVHKKSFAEQLTLVNEACREYFQLDPRANATLAKLLNWRDSFRSLSLFPELRWSGEMLIPILNTCDTFGQFLRQRNAGGSNITILPKYPARAHLITIKLDWDALGEHAKKLLQTKTIKEEKDVARMSISEFSSIHWDNSVLLDSFQFELDELKSYLQSLLEKTNYYVVADDSEAANDFILEKEYHIKWNKIREDYDLECSYDPVASLARIQEALKLDCVDSALVPEEKFLMNSLLKPLAEQEKSFSGSKGSVRYQFTTNDRFGLVLAPNCGATQ